jgi:Cu/Ag efflux protein CusF
MKRSLFPHWLTLVLLASLIALALPVLAARSRKSPAISTDTLHVAPNAAIVVGTNHRASLSDLKVGDRVGLVYAQENGSWVIHRISDGVPHKPHNPGVPHPPKAHQHAGTSGLLHVHGVIQGVNLQANTLTISHGAK